jgi:hypothetical protein
VFEFCPELFFDSVCDFVSVLDFVFDFGRDSVCVFDLVFEIVFVFDVGFQFRVRFDFVFDCVSFLIPL